MHYLCNTYDRFSFLRKKNVRLLRFEMMGQIIKADYAQAVGLSVDSVGRINLRKMFTAGERSEHIAV